MRDKFIILSTEGPACNVIKFKPPMCFSLDDARNLLARLSEVLQELEALPASKLEGLAKAWQSDHPAHHFRTIDPLPGIPELQLDTADILPGTSDSASPTGLSDDSGVFLLPKEDQGEIPTKRRRVNLD